MNNDLSLIFKGVIEGSLNRFNTCLASFIGGHGFFHDFHQVINIRFLLGFEQFRILFQDVIALLEA